MYGSTFPPPEGDEDAAPSTWGKAPSSWKKDAPPDHGGQKRTFQRAPETDFSLYRPCTILGDREMPPAIIAKAVDYAKKLEALGFTVRVSATNPLEEAVEKAITRMELILPFKGFADRDSKFTFVSERSRAVAAAYHPTFNQMSAAVQCFLAKNARMLLGSDMHSPARFLITWTEDGITDAKNRTPKTGFLLHPIKIANGAKIPIYNLGSNESVQALDQYLASCEPAPVITEPPPRLEKKTQKE